MKALLLACLLTIGSVLLMPQLSHAYTIDVSCIESVFPPLGQSGTSPNVICQFNWEEGGSPLAARAQWNASLCIWLNCNPVLHNLSSPQFSLADVDPPALVWIRCVSQANTYDVIMGATLYKLVITGSGSYWGVESTAGDSEHTHVEVPVAC